MTTPYHPPMKRSLAIHGHKTSISLEPLFWDMLKVAATREGVAMARLVARIDGERIKADPAPGLAGAIRVWLMADAALRSGEHHRLAARPGTAFPDEDRTDDQ